MKKTFIVICIFFILKGAYSQDFYFYQGNRIDLEKRTDKLAIVLNSSQYTEDYLQRSVEEMITVSGEVKKVEENVYLISFEGKKSTGEILNLIESISTRSGLVKFATPVYFGDSRSVTQIPSDEIIVRIRNTSDREKLNILNSQNGMGILGNVGDERGYLLKSFDNIQKNALELSQIYYSTGIVEYAEPNFIYPLFGLLNLTPNDANYPSQWALNNTGQSVSTEGYTPVGDAATVNGISNADMDVNLAWDFTTGSSSIEVGVFDTGIDSTHPDFASAGHLLAGYDAFYNKYGVPRDSGSHGTATAGLIGAILNNSIGVAGIAPLCKLMSIRIFNAAGSATDVGIARGFDTARVKGIDILSNSWGGGTPIATVTNAINNAATSGRGGLGCVILFSSGNDGRNPPNYPSYLSNVICVGASTTHDQKKAPGTGNQFWWGGNYGSDVSGDIDVVAPTVCYTTDVQGTGGYNTSAGTAGNYYATFNGTSCSCPNAAGVAALILSSNISQTRATVTERLCRGCDKIDNAAYSTTKTYGKWNEYFGYGRVNALNSVRLVSGIDVTPPTINHLNRSSISSTYPINITAEILDQDGAAVPTTGNNQPKLFYRFNKNNAGFPVSFDSVNASTNSGNNFTFKIPCVGHETQVQYYIRARDNSGNTSFFPRGAPNVFRLCYYAVGTFNTATNKLGAWNAPDGNVGLSSNIAFSSFTILNTAVRIYLKHTFVSDEIIQLYSPEANSNNNRKCLFSQNGGSLDNITGAVVADSATQFWNAGTPPYTNGLFKGDYVLNGFNGINANGNWRILNYDTFSGDAPIFDSVRITFTKTSGTSSSAARVNSEGDTIINFGTVNYPDSVTKNFYLKNVGNANLTVGTVTFTGTYASKFSLVNTPPATIAQNDSGLFIVRLKSSVPAAEPGSGEIDAVENALMNIVTNDPSKPTFKVSLQSDNNLPNVKTLQCTAFIQGFYNPVSNVMVRDTIRAYVRNSSSPYAILDSSKIYVLANGSGSFTFTNASIANGVNYYIMLKHRNSIETWSKSPGQQFSAGTLTYNFTSAAAQAFGSNLIQVDASPVTYAIYGGDVNRDGIVEAIDAGLVDNAAANFTLGYVNTDVTGDNFVDGLDASLIANNAASFVSVIRP